MTRNALVRACLMCALMAWAAPATESAARSAAPVEDGYDLWLRYRQLPSGPRLTEYRGALTRVVVDASSPTIDAARDELTRGLGGLLGNAVTVDKSVSSNGSIILGTPKSSRLVASLELDAALKRVGPEGFVLRSITVGGKRATVIAANSDVGVLYGAFDLLRRVQTLQGVSNLAVSERAAHPGAHARPLGQPQSQRRARVRRIVVVGLAAPSGFASRTVSRLRARQCVDRHQRRGADQRQRQREVSHAGVSDQGRRARRRVPPVRRQGVSHRALQRSDRDRRIEDRRPARLQPCARGGRTRPTRSTSTYPTSAGSW